MHTYVIDFSQISLFRRLCINVTRSPIMRAMNIFDRMKSKPLHLSVFGDATLALFGFQYGVKGERHFYYLKRIRAEYNCLCRCYVSGTRLQNWESFYIFCAFALHFSYAYIFSIYVHIFYIQVQIFCIQFLCIPCMRVDLTRTSISDLVCTNTVWFEQY